MKKRPIEKRTNCTLNLNPGFEDLTKPNGILSSRFSDWNWLMVMTGWRWYWQPSIWRLTSLVLRNKLSSIATHFNLTLLSCNKYNSQTTGRHLNKFHSNKQIAFTSCIAQTICKAKIPCNTSLDHSFPTWTPSLWGRGGCCSGGGWWRWRGPGRRCSRWRTRIVLVLGETE